EGGYRFRVHKTPIQFMEDDHAAWSQVLGQPAQHFARIGLSPEQITTDNKIKWLVKNHFGWVPLAKRDLTLRTCDSCLARGRERSRSKISTAHLARGAHETGGQESNGACPAADIQNTHARRHARSHKIFARRRFKGLCLACEPLKLEIGMTHPIR